MGNAKILNQGKNKSTVATLLSVKDDLFGKHSGTPGVYSAEMEFVLKRYEVAGALPVKPKARYDRGSEHSVITQVLKQTGAAIVLLRESKVSLFFDAEKDHEESKFNIFGRPILYLLRNNLNAEALWAVKEPGPSFDMFDLFQKRLHTISLALRYVALTNSGQKLTELNDDWLASAEIVRIEAKEVGRFKKTVRVDGFLMGAQ